MNKDRIIGLLIFIGSILGIIIYAWLLFFINPIIIIQITLFIAVSAILSWIGYTLTTTPSPKAIEEIEKELEEAKTEKSEVKEKKL